MDQRQLPWAATHTSVRLGVTLSKATPAEALDAQQHAEVATGGHTMRAVSDTNHGMTPDIVARVFKPFFTTKQDGTRTGLGLASAGLAKLMQPFTRSASLEYPQATSSASVGCLDGRRRRLCRGSLP